MEKLNLCVMLCIEVLKSRLCALERRGPAPGTWSRTRILTHTPPPLPHGINSTVSYPLWRCCCCGCCCVYICVSVCGGRLTFCQCHIPHSWIRLWGLWEDLLPFFFSFFSDFSIFFSSLCVTHWILCKTLYWAHPQRLNGYKKRKSITW